MSFPTQSSPKRVLSLLNNLAERFIPAQLIYKSVRSNLIQHLSIACHCFINMPDRFCHCSTNFRKACSLKILRRTSRLYGVSMTIHGRFKGASQPATMKILSSSEVLQTFIAMIQPFFHPTQFRIADYVYLRRELSRLEALVSERFMTAIG